MRAQHCLPVAARASMLLLGLALAMSTAWADSVWVGRFVVGDGEIPAPWRLQRFDERVPATRYRLRLWDGVAAIEAEARQSMALLARPLDIDLAATPVLCWRWRIDAPLRSADMTTKAGDDYAARVYLSFAVAPAQLDFATRTRLALGRTLFGKDVPDAALNYVWDNLQPLGTLRANAYTDRARMIVLRTGAADAGRWVEERRDVGADFARAFGHAPARLTGLAIASDTDNTGEDAHAGFAEFRFVAAADDCGAGR